MLGNILGVEQIIKTETLGDYPNDINTRLYCMFVFCGLKIVHEPPPNRGKFQGNGTANASKVPLNKSQIACKLLL